MTINGGDDDDQDHLWSKAKLSRAILPEEITVTDIPPYQLPALRANMSETLLVA
jgi:hypothetical protein